MCLTPSKPLDARYPLADIRVALADHICAVLRSPPAVGRVGYVALAVRPRSSAAVGATYGSPTRKTALGPWLAAGARLGWVATRGGDSESVVKQRRM